MAAGPSAALDNAIFNRRQRGAGGEQRPSCIRRARPECSCRKRIEPRHVLNMLAQTVRGLIWFREAPRGTLGAAGTTDSHQATTRVPVHCTCGIGVDVLRTGPATRPGDRDQLKCGISGSGQIRTRFRDPPVWQLVSRRLQSFNARSKTN